MLDIKNSIKVDLTSNIDYDDKILLGVSGGADSMCLLNIAMSIFKRENIHVIHINHNLRGKEAVRDENLVRLYCRENDINFKKIDVDVNLKKNEGYSEEEAARILRHEALEKERELIGAKYILLAHNRDDVCETFLLNLCRGSGLKGLTSIDKINKHTYRPLLAVAHKDIEEYVKANNIPYIVDSTNKETKYTRNKIRLEVLPYLKNNINENVKEHIYSSITLLKKQENLINKIISKEKWRISKVDYGFKIDTNNIDDYILSELIRISVNNLVGLRDLTRQNIDDILNLSKATNLKRINVKKNIVAKNCYNGIFIGEDIKYNYEVAKENLYQIDNTQLGYKFIDNFSLRLDVSKRQGKIFFRKRENGDYLIRKNKKIKLKDYLIKKNINLFLRDELNLLLDDKRVIWIEDMYIDSEYANISKNADIIYIKKLEEQC